MSKNSNKIIASVVATAFVLGSASLVLAAETRTSPTQVRTAESLRKEQETRAMNLEKARALKATSTREIKNVRASTTAQIKEKREQERIEVKNRLDEKKQNTVRLVITNRVKLYERLINQLGDRVKRVSEVSATMKTAGKNTASADALLADAKSKLTDASNQLSIITISASTTVSAANPTEKLNQLKELFGVVTDDLRIAHKDISDAISALKGLGPVENRRATTTNSTN